MYWYGHDMAGWWGFPLGLILMALFWGAVIYGILLLVRRAGRGSQPAGPDATWTGTGTGTGTAERLLAERFARGEIDEEEYRRRLAALRAGR